jgi:hypothetical protein
MHTLATSGGTCPKLIEVTNTRFPDLDTFGSRRLHYDASNYAG